MNSFYEIAEHAWRLEAAGKDIIRLNVGNTALPAPTVAIEAATKSLATLKSGYVSAAGLPKLLEAIATRENCSVDEVAVGTGSKQILFALFSLLGKGKAVATPAPFWPAYPLVCKQLNIPFKPLKTHPSTWQLNDEYDLEGVGLIIICNPLNPTSTLFSQASLEKLAQQAAALNIPMIIDEAYRDIAFTKIESIPNTIRVRSFSKEFNMEGWRLGYVVAPHPLIKEVIQFNQISITCAPPFIQEAGIACLKERDSLTANHREIWKKRLQSFGNALKEAGFNFAEPQSGMYVFGSHPKIFDTDSFARKLLEFGVAVAPGSAFGGFSQHIRFSASEGEERLLEAVKRIKRCLADEK